MAEKELDEAKKLTPEDRIRRLREIAKRNEDEIRKAEEMIRQSEGEIKEESRRKFPIPEQEEVHISRLFRRESEKELEHKVAEENIRPEAKEEAKRQYEIQEIRYAPRQDFRQSFEELADDIRNTARYEGSPTDQQMNKLESFMYASQSKITDGSYVRDAREVHEAAKLMRERYKG